MVNKIKNLSKKQKWLCVVCAIALLITAATAIPYRGTGRESLIGTSRGDKISQYITEHSGVRQAGKECPAYDEAYGMTTYDHEPSLSNVVSLTRLGVYGTLGKKEYICYSTKNGVLHTQKADNPDDLPHVSSVRYTLKVKRAFIGSLGWQRTLQVEAMPQLAPVLEQTSAAVFLLNGYNGIYSPISQEHGIFTVDNKGRVYALSYMSCASAYDGKSVSKLISGIRKTRREMGLW